MDWKTQYKGDVISSTLIYNIILNSETLKAFPLRSQTRQGYSLSTHLFNIVLEDLARAIKQKRSKSHPNQTEVKLFLFHIT